MCGFISPARIAGQTDRVTRRVNVRICLYRLADSAVFLKSNCAEIEKRNKNMRQFGVAHEI